jgi:low affinity Fe/Cu permease
MTTKSSAKNSFSKSFEKISSSLTRASGSPAAVLIAMGVIITWAFLGPVFGYSDTWQLVINTGTTIVTFIMVFIIQHSQNKDTIAIQLKLNELIAANDKASNRLVNIEELTEEELQTIKKFYQQLAVLSKKEHNIFNTHSIDEARDNHLQKKSSFSKKK